MHVLYSQKLPEQWIVLIPCPFSLVVKLNGMGGYKTSSQSSWIINHFYQMVNIFSVIQQHHFLLLKIMGAHPLPALRSTINMRVTLQGWQAFPYPHEDGILPAAPLRGWNTITVLPEGKRGSERWYLNPGPLTLNLRPHPCPSSPWLQKGSGLTQATRIPLPLDRRQATLRVSPFIRESSSDYPLPTEKSAVAASCIWLDEDRRGHKDGPPPSCAPGWESSRLFPIWRKWMRET